MKRIVRKCVFESNSSSQHSISVMKESEHYTPEEINESVYLFKDIETGEEHCVWDPLDFRMDFGRSPFKCLCTFTDKWLYCCAALSTYGDDTYKELERIAKKYIPGLKKIKMPMKRHSTPIAGSTDSDYCKKYGKTEEEMEEYLEELQKKYDSYEILDFWTDRDKTYWIYELPYTGYAEDYGMMKNFLDEKNLSLEEFLTNKKYVIIVDGDEYCVYDDLKSSGLIDINAIEYEYPEYNY